jgi:hypothetical protein
MKEIERYLTLTKVAGLVVSSYSENITTLVNTISSLGSNIKQKSCSVQFTRTKTFVRFNFVEQEILFDRTKELCSVNFDKHQKTLFGERDDRTKGQKG